MENLNAEQIKKALEWCSSGGNCINCSENNKNPFLSKEGCMAVQMRNALALIKKLTEKNAIQIITAIELDKQVQRLTEENERLLTVIFKKEETMQMISQEKQAYYDELQTVRADTVKKMHHKIWLEFSDCYEEETVSIGSLRASIDQIAKEMLEGENEASGGE